MKSLPPRCADLTREQVLAALRSHDAMRALLEHMARVARPREGATKILVPLGRLASKSCTWIDGGLAIDISDAGGERTKIGVAVDIGGGARELLFPKLVLEVPWDEFASAIESAPVLVAPMKSRVKKRTILLACDGALIGTVAPPSFAIAEDSWRRSLPPAVQRSLVPSPVDMPRVGEEELLARARLAAPRAPVVADDDLSELRGLGASRPPRRKTTKPPPPKKKIIVVKKRPKSG